VGLERSEIQEVKQVIGEKAEPRILANSVPKAGTHLLEKCLSLFPGLSDSGIHVDMNLSPEALRETLGKIESGLFVSGHLPGSRFCIRLLQELGFKTFLIIRDPRDVAVSHFHYVTKSTYHRLHDYYTRLPDDDVRLMASIRGFEEKLTEKRRIGRHDIKEFFRIFEPWFGEDINYVVRFEALVGPKGGGSRDAQIQEIKRMAEHLDVNMSLAEIEDMAGGIFDQEAATFRKGMIGDWQNHFTSEHTRAFKEVAGQLLIELGYEKDFDW